MDKIQFHDSMDDSIPIPKCLMIVSNARNFAQEFDMFDTKKKKLVKRHLLAKHLIHEPIEHNTCSDNIIGLGQRYVGKG